MASNNLAVFCVLLASLLFVAQAVLAVRGLAETNDASEVNQGGSYGGQYPSPSYAALPYSPPH
ncbi:hypothetical protein EJB05_53451 [Eragrostis curvula]|uniref:Uncharacterized protein n=1 Tax=Eragrostis curvula TaxID=38414 RepID=A0A5J9SIN4_9POAL|nr:hypothetical protein EJB05_55767 [Eragrostis curvula]TVU01092.1 hypothetical protein EJB05_53450 [Eragrostis curvula]TVU01093.1 hypothetical protein EJB05_53451 [Eragrostis curvula]